MCLCDETTKNRKVQEMFRGRPSTNNLYDFIQQILPLDLMKVELFGCIQQLVLLGDTGKFLKESLSSWGFGLVRNWKYKGENEKRFRGLKMAKACFHEHPQKREGWVSCSLILATHTHRHTYPSSANSPPCLNPLGGPLSTAASGRTKTSHILITTFSILKLHWFLACYWDSGQGK